MTQAATLNAAAAPTTRGVVRSTDGTAIAYECAGQGPALVLVDGAMCSREMGPMEEIAKLLVGRYTVYRYDRRGRGESGNTLPYAPEREYEDVEALIAQAGGSAYVFGISSGAALALEVANRTAGVTKLALFEAPFVVDGTRAPVAADYLPRLQAALAADRRTEAAKMFMRVVGMPSVMLFLMPLMPVWKKIKRVAPTLPYDALILGDTQSGRPLPRDRWTRLSMPILVLDGGKSPAWMRNANAELAAVLPGARHQTLPGQTHMIKAPALVPALVAFFGG